MTEEKKDEPMTEAKSIEPVTGARSIEPVTERKKPERVTEKKEIERLNAIYKNLPENNREVVQGLIVQAARLRVRLDKLWRDLRKNGETELFSQSDKTEPYMRERPESKIFTATDKNYQAIIKQLNDICPESEKKDGLDAFNHEFD